jgi:hypothetical protein
MEAEVDDCGNMENYTDYINGTLYCNLVKCGLI